MLNTKPLTTAPFRDNATTPSSDHRSLALVSSAPPSMDALTADFEAFHDRFAPLFARSEPRRKAAQYIRCLMSPVGRRNGWQIADAVGDKIPDAMQRLLYHAKWSAGRARDMLMDFVVEEIGHEGAVVVLGDTSFIKRGRMSVGVDRQRCGTTDKIENCQIGVFIVYVAERGRVLIDRRLYLPPSWCDDMGRRARAHVPSHIRFRSRSELAHWMLRRAWRRGVPMAWVTGDEVYGNDQHLRAAIVAEGACYVFAVARSTLVWAASAEVEAPASHCRLRSAHPFAGGKLPKGEPLPVTAAEVMARLPASEWRQLDEQHEWVVVRVAERGGLSEGERWLLARRSVSTPSEIKYFLSNASAATPLEVLAHVAMTRVAIDRCFDEAKRDLGLDQYEVRTWPSWYRHITLTMMAQAWLASVNARLAELKFSWGAARQNDSAVGGPPTRKKIPGRPLGPPGKESAT